MCAAQIDWIAEEGRVGALCLIFRVRVELVERRSPWPGAPPALVKRSESMAAHLLARGRSATVGTTYGCGWFVQVRSLTVILVATGKLWSSSSSPPGGSGRLSVLQTD